ncbi:hypothetical protein [Myxococcus sp. CA040A]|uniref:hypothetical protein n=1 Tax=Myxococcus sp. CA040A TaxID=2741738 RepID=UPI00157A95B9|nr:hypothetical protein [Myxococcus sp. CA040A]
MAGRRPVQAAPLEQPGRHLAQRHRQLSPRPQVGRRLLTSHIELHLQSRLQCDDGNLRSLDGCGATCQLELP